MNATVQAIKAMRGTGFAEPLHEPHGTEGALRVPGVARTAAQPLPQPGGL